MARLYGPDYRADGDYSWLTPPRDLEIMLSAKYNSSMNARDMARALGRRGGRVRAERLSATRRTHIASLGGAARALSLDVARRIDDNFRYAAAARELRGASLRKTGKTRIDGRLPGIYPPKA